MSADSRGWRMALVPQILINPRDPFSGAVGDAFGVACDDALVALELTGYGLMQLPPAGGHGHLLAVIADQVAEYAHHGYAVVALGVHGEEGGGLHWRRLSPRLRHRGVDLPPRYLIQPTGDRAAERQRLSAFLSGYDLPVDEQRRWRM